MTDLKNYVVPQMFKNCDFAETIMPDGTVLRTDGEPIILNNGNIVFPVGWSDEQRARFRATKH